MCVNSNPEAKTLELHYSDFIVSQQVRTALTDKRNTNFTYKIC